MTIVPEGSLLGALSGSLPGTAARRAFFTDSDLWSVFAQLTWTISDTWRLNIGGRYTDEDKSGARSIDIVDVTEPSPVQNILGQPRTADPVAPIVYFAGFGIINEQFGGGHNLAGERNETKFTPAINLQWDATDNSMWYLSVTEGFKAGGYDARANTFNQDLAAIGTGGAAFEYEGEEVTAYELGGKLSLAGGAAELNIAVYYMEYTDLQTSQFDGTLGFNVTNAGEATTQGVELDGRWQVSENFLLTGALGFLDFEFDEFPNSQCFFGETPDSPTVAGLCDRKGDVKEFTPEVTANIGGTYIVPIGSTMELSLGVDVAYSDDYFVSPTLDPNLAQDAYTKVNARIGLDAVDGSWSLALIGENLTDEEILTFGNQAPVSTTLSGAFNAAIGAPGVATAYYGFYEAPLNVALQARYNF